MKNIKEKINKWEELNKLLPKTVNRFRVYEIIEEIEKQSLSFQKQEIEIEQRRKYTEIIHKNYQRFIEILEELNEFVETESGKSGRKEILQKIQEVIKQLKDEEL